MENNNKENNEVQEEVKKTDDIESNEQLSTKKSKYPVFFMGLFIITVIGLFIAYQNQVHYSFAYIPNKQIDKIMDAENKDRQVRLSIHSENEKIAFFIDEKIRKDEYQGDFQLELSNKSLDEKFYFESQYFVDNYSEVLKSGFYQRYIESNDSNLTDSMELDKSLVKYSLLGKREVINSVNGKQVTFRNELDKQHLTQVLMLKGIDFNNTVYGNWYNKENEVRQLLMPDSEDFPDFRKGVKEFLLSTDVKSAQIYTTFKDSKLETWGIDFVFTFVDSDNKTHEWKVYLDMFYTENESSINREDLTNTNSILIRELSPELYNNETNPYYKNSNKDKEGNEVETDISEGNLDITIEELDELLMNGDPNVITEKENKE